MADLPTEDPEPLIHAPGHVPKRVSRGADPVHLEGDDVLTLHCPGLRELTASANLVPWLPSCEERFHDVCAFGFADEHCWILACEAQRINEDWPRMFGAVLKLRDRSTIMVQRALAPGRHTEYWLPLGDAVGRARVSGLEVGISGPEESLKGPLRLHLCSLLAQDERLLVDEELDWGRLQVYAPEVAEERVLEDGARNVRFESVPLGCRCLLSCLCEQTGAHARVLFTHDGSRVELVLRRGIRVIGSLVVPGGARQPEQLHVKWWFSGSGAQANRDDPSVWTGRVDVSVDASGAISLILPRTIPRMDTASYPPPPLGSLLMGAEGFLPLAREFQVPPDGGTVDLGPLVLEALGPAFVLAPGHGIDGEALAWSLAWADDGSILGYRMSGGEEAEDGSLGVFLVIDPSAESQAVLVRAVRWPSGEECLLPWPDARARALLLAMPDQSHAFRLGADGRYVRVPNQEYDVTFMPFPGSTEERWVDVDWRWNSMNRSLGMVAVPADRAAHVSFRAPVSGVEFCWVPLQMTANGVVRGTECVVPLTASTATVELDAP
ncbi:MAG: hypothetical protein HY812_11385 [Planctomycetes bacterium]|nr:hypothetical protein [Planctomycetota bacterium]